NLTPTSANSTLPPSKEHSEPDGFLSPSSDVNHSASRTFTTNHPSVAGASPEAESSSRASGIGSLVAVHLSEDVENALRHQRCCVRVIRRQAGVGEVVLITVVEEQLGVIGRVD